MTPLSLVLWGGAVIGLIFGGAAQVSGFCLHRGLIQHWRRDDGQKLRSFALALLVALIGTQGLAASGGVDLSQSIYRMASYSWLLVPLGGVLFGYGMVLANGCGARSLVLLGQGNLRALLTLLALGIAAYATLLGVLAPLRLAAAEITAFRPGVWGGPFTWPYWLASLAFAATLAIFALWRGRLMACPRDFWAGLIIGLTIVAGWWVTGHLGADDFDPLPLASLTFVAPIGETIQYLMIATGASASFGVTVVAGVFLGSLLTALVRRDFRWQAFDGPGSMGRSLGGGGLMGVGGALALGCSIGQGLTGLSTLSLSSVLAAVGIVVGSRLALPMAKN